MRVEALAPPSYGIGQFVDTNKIDEAIGPTEARMHVMLAVFGLRREWIWEYQRRLERVWGQ